MDVHGTNTTDLEIPIPRGFFLFARKIFDLFEGKPPMYFKLYAWMLSKAFFQNKGGLKRGQFRTSFDEMSNAVSYNVGFAKRYYSKKQIRAAADFLVKGCPEAPLIEKKKVTHGMIVTVLNYDEYQTPANYEGHHECNDERLNKGTATGTIIKKERKKRKEVTDRDKTFSTKGEKKNSNHEEEIRSCLMHFFPFNKEIDLFMDNLTRKDNLRELSDSRKLSILRELKEFFDRDVLNNHELFKSAVMKVNEKGIGNVDYLKKVMQTLQRENDEEPNTYSYDITYADNGDEGFDPF